MLNLLTISENWLSSFGSINTQVKYRADLNTFIDCVFGKNLTDITEEDFENLNSELVQRTFIEQLREKGVSDSTIKSKFKSINSFLTYLEEMCIFKSVNYTLLKKRILSTKTLADDSKSTRALNKTDYDNLRRWLFETKYVNDQRMAEKYSLLIEFMWNTCSRVSAVFNIKWSDFKYEKDFENVEGWCVYVRDKGNKVNYKPLQDDTFYDRLKDCFYTGDDNNKVFVACKQNTLRDLLKEFSLPFGGDITPHSIKKGAITYVYHRTKDLELCRVLGDHEDINTTKGYIESEKGRLAHGSIYLMDQNQDYRCVEKIVGKKVFEELVSMGSVSVLAQLAMVAEKLGMTYQEAG